MQDRDLDAPNSLRESHGGSRLFLEDDPLMSVEADVPMSVEDDTSMSLRPKRTSRASAVFLFLLLVAVGVGGALGPSNGHDQTAYRNEQAA